MTDEETLKARYPDAYLTTSMDQPLWMICTKGSGHMLGWSKVSGNEAWASARASLEAKIVAEGRWNKFGHMKSGWPQRLSLTKS